MENNKSGKAQPCIVCNGKGIVLKEIYKGSDTDNASETEICKCCAGKGYIVI